MMLALTPLLLMLATVLTIIHGQASVCYSSLDCHGNLLNVVLPEKAGASAFSSECCSAAVRGLSYQSRNGEAGCQNCYTDANFESQGDKFYLGLFGNFQPNDFFRIGKVRLSVTPIGAGQSRFTLDFLGKDNKYTAPTEVELKADDVNLDSEKTRDQAIIVRSETGDQLSVVAYAEEYSSSDTFKVMPCVHLPDSGYEYYAVSVPRAGLTFTHIITQEEISAPLQGKSAMVIVTTEENTEISITLTQDIANIDANDIMDQIGGGDTLRAGEEYSFTFSKGAQTLYLASEDDLTGSRVVSNKPIAFISGHECGTVPFNIHYCDQLIEQLPPTSTWGKRFITAPIAARAAVDIFKVLASRNGTIFQSSCSSDVVILNAGEFREFNISSSTFCYFESNQPVLMVQFSVASDLDQVLAGDPFMVVVPPIEQYRNNYNISIFNSSVPDADQAGVNYINILIPADSASPDEVRFDGQPLPPFVQFREIPCIFSERICAFAAQMNISSVPHFLTTVNSNAMVNAIVYWLSLRVGSGYFAGMTQNPIALPSISLDQDAYTAMENATLNVTIFRSGDLTLPVTAYLTTAPMSGDNAALVGDDFIPETRELILTAGVNFLDVFITFVNDVFPEGPEQFEVFLSAAPGALIVSPAYASVTILNDDPPLPVMNVSFAVTDVAVSEGEGLVTLILEKTEGAIGPVSVRIFTTAGTAIDGRDFAAINDTLEFGVDVTQMEVMIFITDNSALEDVEQFIVEIEPVPGVFPVAVMDSTATVTITDNDVVVLGFERPDYLFSELSDEAASVRVEVLFGQLERSVAVWINSTEASTATPNLDFAEVSRVLTFDSERTIDFVGIGIIRDSEREVVTETINLQLSFVEEERSSGLLLLPSQATVNIIDNDEVEVGLSLIRGTVREGDGGARVNVSVVQGSLGNNMVSFIVSTVNGSAQGGLDYVQQETTISLSGQNPFEELLIDILDDSEYEGPSDEEFFVQVNLAPNGQNSERVRISADLAEVSVNINDNERRPVARVGFVRDAWTVSEDAGEVILLVESDGSNVDPVIVSYSLNGTGTAQDGSDFILTGVGVLLFPPGAIVDSIIIPILDDELPESIESFSINLSPGLDVDLTTALATVTINDNDAVMVRFSMPSYTVSEAAVTVRVAVQISSASEPVRVNVSTMDATALAGLDYMPVQVELVFLPGEFEKMISISLVNDNFTEGQELFMVTLHSSMSDLRVELPNPTSSIFIIDDDRVGPPLAPSISVSSISATSASLEWTQNLDQPVASYFLRWTYTGPCARQPPLSMLISGTARNFTITGLEEGGSYTFGLTGINGEGTGPENTTTGQALPTVPSGAPRNLQASSITETSISIHWDEIECLEQNGAISSYSVSLNGNPPSIVSSNTREFTLTGLFPQINYTISVFGANAQGNGPSRSITVQTARRPVAATIGFVPDEYTVNETDGSVTLMVRLISGVLEREVVIDFEATPDSATSAAPADYVRTVRQLTFSPTVDVNSVSVNIIDDNIHEDNERFFGNLAAAADQLAILNPDTAVVTIIDDNDPIIIGSEQIEYNVTEGDQTEVCAILIAGILEKDVLVSVNSSDGTAIVGADYNAVALTLTFNAGTSRACFLTSTVDDGRFEEDEIYLLTLTSDEPGLILVSDVAVVTIPNDDSITIGLTNTTFVVTEGDGAFVEVCARVFQGELEKNAVVTLQTMDGSAVSQRTEPDYQSLTVQLTFTPSTREICQNVVIINDEFYEDPEDLIFRLTTEERDVILSPDMGTITILDEEEIVIGFVEPSYVILESGGQQQVCAEIKSGNLRASASVQFSTASGDAIAPSDYNATTATFTFAATQSQECVNVPIISDNVDEGSENFTGNLSTRAPRVTLNPAATVITINEPGGPVVCRASVNCAGGPGDDLAVAVSGESCCLDFPAALAYSPTGSEECIACVVVGFHNASFSGVEQGPGHNVPVGYLKGGTVAGQNLVFNVENTQGTAREGSQFDYTVSTLRVRALANGQIQNVVLTFRVDTIAQEPNETFTLTLNPLVAPTPRVGLFFRNTIQVTIMDSDIVEFSFTEDSYRANEPDFSNPVTSLPVLVSKSARIASRVELVVVPLTVDEARATSLRLPPNIPDDDPRSPPFANLNDLNNTNITLVFEPDEDAEVNEKSTPFFVTDDAINEATEQVFIAELRLVSSIDPATVDLTTRPSTLCRIIDNDPIRIGFELPGYTYDEPQFEEFIDQFFVSPTGRPENGPIYLVKEDNVISEQTFLVSIQVTDSAPSGTNIQTATLGQDYSLGLIGQTSTTEFFFPSQQRIPFFFTLFTDTLPEGDEAFQASVSPEDTRDLGGGMVEQFPTSLNPLTLASEVFITIIDYDPIIIGFTNTSYTVDEGIGTLQIDVQVFSPPDDQPLLASVDFVIQTVSGSATGGSDYAEISADNLDVFLIFDNDNRLQSFSVVILDDNSTEDMESFSLELRFDPFVLQPSNIVLSPNVSVVTILDNDEAVLVRLADGSNNLEGRVEIFALGAWGTVCDDNWDIVDAAVVCRQLGFASAIEALNQAHFGQGSGVILLDEVRCDGSESRLIDCPANALGNSDCSHREDAGVRCLETAECTDGSARLVNGSSSLNGRLEVCAFRIWGTVCDDQFDSNAAMVACRQLGLTGGVILSRDSYPFGSDNVPIWLDNVRCSGTEASLFNCNTADVGITNCDHNEDIGVQCTARPDF